MTVTVKLRTELAHLGLLNEGESVAAPLPMRMEFM